LGYWVLDDNLKYWVVLGIGTNTVMAQTAVGDTSGAQGINISMPAERERGGVDKVHAVEWSAG